MWRELIQSLNAECTFEESATSSQILEVEKVLGLALPDELKSLLIESNGVVGEWGLGLIWSTERIKEENLAYRHNPALVELYMPFSSLFFFADRGNGDVFAYRILAGVVKDRDIFEWDHENDSRTWMARSLQHYLELVLKRN